MSQYTIMAVLINHRKERAKEVQEYLTRFGCNIKMRLGLHEASTVCAEDGLVLLQLTGEENDISALKLGLNGIDGVKAKMITISSD